MGLFPLGKLSSGLYFPKQQPTKYIFNFYDNDDKGNIKNEPLIGVIREQGECPFKHKGAGGTIFVGKQAAESKPGANLDI